MEKFCGNKTYLKRIIFFSNLLILLILLFLGYKSFKILKKNYSQNHKIAKKHSLILFDSISTRVINDFYFISYLYTINDYFLFKEDKQVKARFLNKLSGIYKTYNYIVFLYHL